MKGMTLRLSGQGDGFTLIQKNLFSAPPLRATSTVDRRSQEHTVSSYKYTETLLLHITTGQMVHMHKQEHRTLRDA